MDQRQGTFEMKPGITLAKLEPMNNLLYPPVTVGNSAVMGMLSIRWMFSGVTAAAAFVGFLNHMVCIRTAHK